ncbi:uncharacterized protein LOC133493621 isoform X4 [Syngnathoides biaculeatus]|uniref:uncharacterized protein LOC133493621 isoform X4 n=1 Tax=Syngnathoides biaculeatus TaxID=300417 RepID=UPI002ADE38BB|nr:uncharacterized protein LOC133493621 isoform X4 [Syngnathoides biaculeatus]
MLSHDRPVEGQSGLVRSGGLVVRVPVPARLEPVWSVLFNIINPRRKCCDHRVKMCTRTTGEYKEEVRGPKKEQEPQRQLLDALFNLQPLIVLRRAETEALFEEENISEAISFRAMYANHFSTNNRPPDRHRSGGRGTR